MCYHNPLYCIADSFSASLYSVGFNDLWLENKDKDLRVKDKDKDVRLKDKDKDL